VNDRQIQNQCPDLPATAFVALGSNLGDRAGHIRAGLRGLAALPGTRFVVASGLIETDPVGSAPQGRYLNAAAQIRTRLSPADLLEQLLGIERGRGRIRGRRWGPRTLDLDLLVYDALVIDAPGLVLPHPRLHERAFVLEPLAQIAPDLIVPGIEQSVRNLLDGVSRACLHPASPSRQALTPGEAT